MVAETVLPFVSVVIPIRNEARFIADTLNSLVAQDYPPDRLEVIVADGMSDDGTREIVRAHAAKYPRIRLIDNPERVTPNGLNRAIAAARGEIISRVDGHCRVSPDFVSQNVRLFTEHPEAWVVGGPMVHEGEGPIGRAAAVAMSHPLGVGMAKHRFVDFEGYVDTVQFPAFRRWVFDRIGTFDTSLIRTEDDELNYRVVQAGGKLFVSPRVRYVYYVRNRVRDLFRQYFQYSFWRIPVMRKHGKLTTLRQVVPLLFFVAVMVLAAAGAWLHAPLVALVLPLIYTLALVGVAISLVATTGVVVACLSAYVITTMHLAYAGGMAYGLFAFVLGLPAWQRDGRMSALTR